VVIRGAKRIPVRIVVSVFLVTLSVSLWVCGSLVAFVMASRAYIEISDRAHEEFYRERWAVNYAMNMNLGHRRDIIEAVEDGWNCARDWQIDFDSPEPFELCAAYCWGYRMGKEWIARSHWLAMPWNERRRVSARLRRAAAGVPVPTERMRRAATSRSAA